MKKIKKTSTLLAVICLLLTTVLAGCGSNENKEGQSASPGNSASSLPQSTQSSDYPEGLSPDDKITLKMAAPDQGFGTAMFELAVGRFMEIYPNVKIELTTSPKITEIVGAKVAANDDDDMFDLMLGRAGFNPNLIKSGVVEDLSDLMSKPTWDDPNMTMGQDMMESSRELFVYDGKLRLLPADISLISIIYNKKMFTENGWNENPQTWGEFLQLLDTIKASGKTAPIAFAGTVGYLPWLTNMASIYHNGWEERYVKREQGIYSDPANIAPLVKLNELKDKGYFLNGTEALDHTQSQMEFLQGNAAMIPSGSWIENEMKNAAPADFEYGIMIQPTNDQSVDPRYIMGYSDSIWAWAKKPELNKTWTKEFLRFYYSKEVQAEFIKSGGIPVVKSVQKDESLTQFASPFNQEVMKLLTGNVELNLAYSKLPPDKLAANPKYTDADLKVMNNGFLEVYMGIKTPEQVGAAADAEIEKVWAEVGGR
ncbi:extracellular solute-binding protein [Paenibacillus sp. PAMC21692]|uniref:extracellular solute-binding protein n=1 Tax=Paenibacillus sp. PAMC21692 TaxID=2762320 RepID=UPI00164EC302|nr:extracellular solute-binding protein [Paenibacillus sp. PAMC21692]QNK56299.1 extracellular solute-binding protein [Paenibacillus sp. PAMC21692]